MDEEKKGPLKMQFTERRVEKLRCPPDADELVVWDEEQRGLCVRIRATGGASYYVFYRVAGRLRRYHIGACAETALVDARETANRARRLAKEGRDIALEYKEAGLATVPSADSTVEGVAAEWLASTKGVKKESSRTLDELFIRRFIVPALGDRPVANVTFTEVERLHRGISDGTFKPRRKEKGKGSRGAKEGGSPVMANRIRSALSSIMSYAELKGHRAPGTNPCKGLRKNREEPRHRALTELELKRLAKVLREWPTAPRDLCVDEETGRRRRYTRTPERLVLSDDELAARRRAADCIKTILLTGCRRGEIAHLRWAEVNEAASRLDLQDSKVGARSVPICSSALAIIRRQPRTDLNPFVFASAVKDGAPVSDLKRSWAAIKLRAGLGTFRAHDLRHHVGETLASMGYSEIIISKVLGHSRGTTTWGYVAVKDEVLRRAVEEYGQAVGKALGEWPVKVSSKTEVQP